MRPPDRITRADVLKAQELQPWHVGNEALYHLCHVHREHVDKGDVASKVWLIGRSYAASIERHINTEGRGEDVILTKVAPRLLGWHLDRWLEAVPHRRWTFVREADRAVTLHARMLHRLQPLLTRKTRSLVSKYLHFHNRELFPIYDSRAAAAIRRVTPSARRVQTIPAARADEAYRAFCARLLWLLRHVQTRLGVRLSLREADNLLLKIHRRSIS